MGCRVWGIDSTPRTLSPIPHFMKEDFLYFIWRFGYFDPAGFKTREGKAVRVLHPGFPNNDSGADFQNARLSIDGLEWIGAVEMHLSESEWARHGHQTDAAYNNVALHVVWEYGSPAFRQDGSPVPCASLQGLALPAIYDNYRRFLENPTEIPCSPYLNRIKEITRQTAAQKAFAERLEAKAAFARELFAKSGGRWDETAYRLLAHAFGFKINAAPMLRLAEALPLKTLQKHSDNLQQIEALLFGLSGLAEGFDEEYTQEILPEYRFLAVKYGLPEGPIALSEWKFGRIRPANFPTLRLAQLSAFIHQNPDFFASFMDLDKRKALPGLFDVKQSGYWRNHYRFGEKAASEVPGLGKSAIENLLINALAPLLAAYSLENASEAHWEQAVELLESLPAEKNAPLEEYRQLGFRLQNAYDSQALLGLRNNYCSQKKCLQCPIGVEVLGKEGVL